MTDNEKSDTSVEFVSDTQSSDLPPPAYRKSYSNSIKIARILSTTVIFVSIIVGIIVLLALYMRINKECTCSIQESLQKRMMTDYRADVLPPQPLKDNPTPPEKIVSDNQKIPLKLMLDGKANRMMKKNKLSKVNCLVETKKATHIIVPRPKLVITPFGNFTTDPRLIHVAGEKMIFSCFGENKKSKLKKPTDTRVEKRSTEECLCDCAC